MAERPLYPGNSNVDKAKAGNPPEDKKVEKVVKGEVKRKEVSTGRRLLRTFIVEDMSTVMSHIFEDVLVPEIQRTIIDMVTRSVEMIFGQSTSQRSVTQRSPTYTSYSRYSEPTRKTDSRNERRGALVADIILTTRMDAEEALDRMYEILNHYDVVSVADYYAIVGEKSTYTDNNFGWTNLKGAHVMSVKDGYILNLPRPMVIGD